MVDRQATLERVAIMWNGMWSYGIRDDEIRMLDRITKPWPPEGILALDRAANHFAKTSVTKPSIAELVDYTRRLFQHQGPKENLRHGCLDCRGDLLVDVAAIPDGPAIALDWGPALVPCEKCNPVGFKLWEAGAYELDAPRGKFASIVAEAAAK